MESLFEYGTVTGKTPSLSIINSANVWNFSNANNAIYNSRPVLINEPGIYDLVFYYATASNGGKGDVFSVVSNESRDEDDPEVSTVTSLGQLDFYGGSGINVVIYSGISVTTRSTVSVRIQANGKQLLSTGYNILGSKFMWLKNV